MTGGWKSKDPKNHEIIRILPLTLGDNVWLTNDA